MSFRVLLFAAPLVSLFSFPPFVAAGVNVTVNCTSPSYFWVCTSILWFPLVLQPLSNLMGICIQTFNSFGQSPCIVAASMIATCFKGGEFPIACMCGYGGLISLVDFGLAPLPPGYSYSGPSPDYANKCQCSTVGFSLISACVACQGRSPFSCDHVCPLQFSLAYLSICSFHY